EEAAALGILRTAFIKGRGEESAEVGAALRDSYKRLLGPAMETELRANLKEAADCDSIRVFAENLHALLMAPPFGGRRILAVDPGFRSGCKVVALDEQGALIHHETIFPHEPQNRADEAASAVKRIVRAYELCAVAVGNGTAGRETDSWLRSLGLPIEIALVNESGASIYSASEVAREEFPSLDLTVRGAISIGRRFQDPLAELVRIDPKSIGVGQYQHDVDQKKLKSALGDVVTNCVNRVGVQVNIASRDLLKYVSGLSSTLAANVVKFRDENGAFITRDDLRRVPRMGAKAFEQSAGFLRIWYGANPLDASAVHPENYALVERFASDLGCEVADIMTNRLLRKRIDAQNYPDVSESAMHDILSELARPGRDPRSEFEPFSFDENVHSLSDLKPGMRLPGIVSNVTDFGVFVDVGVHQDGLLHRNKMRGWSSKRLVPGSRLNVEVLDVDETRKRISLAPAEALKPVND
ncbi:MAG: helix-hairpin-helix domain-containing protein, partial [Synergistaceae bacterium]|nr:helix-hairpin-helix domain-containing protein [Synergistaceae bacterium]